MSILDKLSSWISGKLNVKTDEHRAEICVHNVNGKVTGWFEVDGKRCALSPEEAQKHLDDSMHELNDASRHITESLDKAQRDLDQAQKKLEKIRKEWTGKTVAKERK